MVHAARDLDDGLARVRAKSGIAPIVNGKAQHGELRGRDVDGLHRGRGRVDAIADVAAIRGIRHGLQRHPKAAEILLVALKHPLKRGVGLGVLALHALVVAVHGGADLLLVHARARRRERDEQIEQALLRRDPIRWCAVHC